MSRPTSSEPTSRFETPPIPARPGRGRRFVAAYGVTFAVSFLVLAVLRAAFPGLGAILAEEDGVIEDLTVAMLALAAAISLATLSSARRRGRPRRGHWLVAGLCLLGVLEELSYGERIIPNLPFPVVLGVRMDALHDVVEVGEVALGRLGLGRRHAAAAAIAAALLLGLLRRPAWSLMRALGARGERAALVGVAVAVGVLAQGLDILGASMFLEETLELEAAVALVFAALAGTALWAEPRARIGRHHPDPSVPGEPGASAP